MSRFTKARFSTILIAMLFVATSCVQIDPKTNDPLPRGEQRYVFDVVQEQAKKLKEGLHRREVLLLLGSPAEKSTDGLVWIYLPERPAFLIPARALRLRFEGDTLVEHGYHAIVLGQQL